jgi:transglutaminase superfamily protein
MSPKPDENHGLTAKLRKARQLSASDWRMLLGAAGWFVIVEFGLRLLALKTLLAVLDGRRRSRAKGIEAPPPSPDRASYCVELASRVYPFEATCLKKALVLFALLKRRGVEVRLVIGATKTDRKLDAHAWLEHQGRVIIGGPSEEYAPLFTLVN